MDKVNAMRSVYGIKGLKCQRCGQRADLDNIIRVGCDSQDEIQHEIWICDRCKLLIHVEAQSGKVISVNDTDTVSWCEESKTIMPEQGELYMKGFIEVRDFEDNSRVLVNVNSILYVFSEEDPDTRKSHAVLFFGHVHRAGESLVSVVECAESYDTVRKLIADAIDDQK